MAGRAKVEIEAKELAVFESLTNELERKGHVINDDSRVKVTFLAPYQSKPAIDIKIILDRLSRYIDINGKMVVTKKELCKILGISKPTLGSWERKGWLSIAVSEDYFIPPRRRQNKEPGFSCYKIDLVDIKKQLVKMTLL